MSDTAILQNHLFVGAVLFALGLIGFLVRRNVIVMFLCVELMLQGVALSLVSWSRYHGDWGGQMLVIFIITVAACEAALGLALVWIMAQRGGSLDIAIWQTLRERDQAPYTDREVPEEDRSVEDWPQLTPAGVEPVHPREEDMYRSHV